MPQEHNLIIVSLISLMSYFEDFGARMLFESTRSAVLCGHKLNHNKCYKMRLQPYSPL